MTPVLVSNDNKEAVFKMTFTADEFAEAINETYKANRHRFTVDGFRRGKAPRSIIERRYGAGIFFEDAIESLMSTGYGAALQQLDLDAVAVKDADFGMDKIEQGKDVTVTITVILEPKVEVKDYKGIEVERKVHTVTDADVDSELSILQKRNARMVTVDREAENGDTVILDYEGWCNGEKFEGGTAENQSLRIGSKTFIDGFEDQLIGAKAGDKKDVNVRFPKEYFEEKLQDQEAVFHCAIKEVKKEEIPELDDEFAKDVSEFDTLEELKADILAKKKESAAKAAEYDGKNNAIKALIDKTEFDIPRVMIENEMDSILQEFKQNLAYQGIPFEEYCKYLGKTEQEIRSGYEDDATNKIKGRLVSKAVASAEGIECSDEEFEEELKKMADQYQMELDKVRLAIGSGENAKMVRMDVIMQKAIDLVYANASFKDVEDTPDAQA